MPAERKIESVAIYPSIGVARVGNSPDEFFFSPEVPGAEPIDADRFRDRKGRIKRQAARFRLYGLDADGEVVREITAKDAEITWTVHVANTKAAWFQFDQAMDIPASEGKVSARRRPSACCATRRSISGTAASSSSTLAPGRSPGPGRTNWGRMRSMPSTLASSPASPSISASCAPTRTGRLIFLGGRGLSGSDRRHAGPPDQFANYPGLARRHRRRPGRRGRQARGRELHAVGAWVLSAPPDYAPGIPAFITGYDLIFEVATKLEPEAWPRRGQSSRSRSILSCRGSRSTQWVNAGFFREFGWGSPMDFSRPELCARLNDPGSSAWRCERRSSIGSAGPTTPSCRPTPGPVSTATPSPWT